MRRAHLDLYDPNWHPGGNSTDDVENQQKEDRLLHKAKALKNLAIDIGIELQEQNDTLKTMTDEFDNQDNFLGRIMKRVQLLSRAGHNKSTT